MSTHVTPAPAARPASARQLDWLRAQITDWSREGLLDPRQAEAILGRYQVSRRLSLGRLLLALGALFVGVGLIWLVAANLDQLSPLGRFLALAAIWLGLLAGGEVLAGQVDRARGRSRAVVSATRLLAAIVFGAVVFQAAQSLQVPAWEPSLVGFWAAGALLHAYAVRDGGPLLVGLLTGAAWFLWQVLAAEPSGLGAVLALLAGAGVSVGVAALHSRGLRSFAAPWREVGAVLGLAALFASALPLVTTEGFTATPWLVAGLTAAAVAVVAGTVLSSGTARLEPIGLTVVAGLAVLLVVWDTGSDVDALTAVDGLHAVLSVAVYVVVAVGVAVLGTLRDSGRLTAVATAALVVFTTFQSFAVFAQIVQGAWLFVVLGVVFLGTGLLFDRARRELVAAIDTEGEGR